MAKYQANGQYKYRAENNIFKSTWKESFHSCGKDFGLNFSE